MVSQRKMGMALGYVNIIAKNLINLMYTPLLLRFLGQGDYGVFQMTNSTVMSLSLLSMGFTSAYVRFYSQRAAKDDQQGIRRLNGMYLLVFLIITGICMICGLVLWGFTNELFKNGLTAEEIGLAKTLILILVFNLAIQFPASVFDSFIMVHEQFVFQQSRQLFSSLMVPVIAVLLLALGCGAVGVAAAQAFVSTVLLLLNIRYAVRTLGMRFDFGSFDWGLFREIAVFSFWIFLNQIFDLINNNVPNFLLGALASSNAVAIFAIATQFRTIFFTLSTTAANVFVPKINRIVADSDDNTALTRLMTRVGRFQMVLFCFIYGGFVLVGRYFISIWAGEGYDDSYWMTLLMTLPVMIPLIQNTGIEIQRAKNKHRARSLVYILTSLVNIVISVILIPTWGYWATTLGYMVSILLGTGLFMNWYYQRRIGLDMLYFWKSMAPVFAVSAGVLAVSGAIAYVTAVQGLAGFFLYGMLYVVLYAVAAWFFIATKEERNTLKVRFSHK
ncbi:hypothetical protein COO72_01510 [Bifidobacterium callitrichos]|nr:hypothetical protein COO72_01510 [Bifidobacterium callitrichos]